ncbi:hypothetical protein ACJMK2_009683 [Sinanodonta woodiana]|uniref:DZIP3-like HEPN domain-containing protein n=1 Tax=Sinanodonta woodiana TaxID=1069815 RepID=A0ABD3VFB6_SINWO
MASSCGSSYGSCLKTTNYARMCRIVVDVFRDILWQVLTNEILPADLPKKVQTDKKKLGKLDLKIKTWLCGISPLSTEIPIAVKFDVTSLYTLIRNLCSQVPAPSTQWGQTPPIGGTTLGDDIERVREFRNILYGHATQAKIETADFNKLCIEIKDVASRFDAYFCSKAMKCDFEREIDTILACFMDKSLEDDYIEKMEQIAILSDDLGHVKHEVADIKKTLESVRDAVYDVRKGVKENAEDSRNHLCRIEGTLERLDIKKDNDKVEDTRCSLGNEERDCNENAGISREDISLEMPQGMEGKICIIKCYTDLKLELERDIVMDIAKDFFKKKKHKDVLEDLRQAGTRRLCIDRLLKRVFQLKASRLKIFFDLLKRKCPERAQKLAEIKVTDKDRENFKQVSKSVQMVPHGIQNSLKFEQLDVEFFQCHFQDIPEKVDKIADVLLSQFHISIFNHSQMMKLNNPVEKIHALLEKIQSCHFDSDSEVQNMLGSSLYDEWQHFRVNGSRQDQTVACLEDTKEDDTNDEDDGSDQPEIEGPDIWCIHTVDDTCNFVGDSPFLVYYSTLLSLAKTNVPLTCPSKGCGTEISVCRQVVGSELYLKWVRLQLNYIPLSSFSKYSFLLCFLSLGLENQGIWHYLLERIQSSREYVIQHFRGLRIRFMQARRGSLVLKFETLDNFDVKLLKPEDVKEKVWDMITTLCPKYQGIFKEPVHLTIFYKPLSNTDSAEIHFYLETSTENEEFSCMKLGSHDKQYIVEEINPASLTNWMLNTLQLDENTKAKLVDLVSTKDISRRKKMKILLNIVESLENGYELLEKYCEEHDTFLYDKVFKIHRQMMVVENPDGAKQYEFSEEGLQRLSSTWIDFTVDPKGRSLTYYRYHFRSYPCNREIYRTCFANLAFLVLSWLSQSWCPCAIPYK